MMRHGVITLRSACASALLALGLIAATDRATATDTTIERMPAALESAFALSALPPTLRDEAGVYLLDPGKGYYLAAQGSSGIACLVQRTAWEMADYRDDIYFPLCYDAAGTATYLKVIMDTAALRSEGLEPSKLKALVEQRYRDGTYRAPEKAGLSYMVGPLMRTVGPPDMQVHTMAMPHLMFYAPGLSNADIGAKPDLANPGSLANPFVDRQGNDAQSYIIQMIGEAEKARILADEKPLLEALCAYRDILCLHHP
ncbi:hypothetical protein A8950_0786 [Dongia mobilis]|uniref:Methanolan biosynthesis EpsI domain-containing protein n=1 Tax=Dongia mobilis TaxID=578943 RepID=A0A4R6X1A2_9PROT|nr:hypothetical protein [Dongia mobilis]TDQ84238.1 hypothetical protein A8950_0786 [Dongia mobilis]